MSRPVLPIVDFHNHLVPGVDDGARTVEDALEALERMVAAGITRIVTTPHLDGSLTLDEERLEERLEEVTAAFLRVSAAMVELFPEVDLRRGHEVMLDVPDVRFEDPRVRLAGSSFVLVEWPRLHIPPGTTRVLERIASEGYRPIVAHPERYIGIDREMHIVHAWREAGAYLQVNYGSLEGRYGAEARSTANRLLERGWVHYLASDFHARPDRKLFQKEAWKRFDEIDGQETLDALTRTNPARILDDLEPLPVPPLPGRRGMWTRLKAIIGQADE